MAAVTDAPISEFCRQERHSECRSENCACYCHRRTDALGRVIRAALDSIPVPNGLAAIEARIRRAPSRARRADRAAQPVTTTRVPELAWAEALRLAGGDVRRLRVSPPDGVLVLNHPRGHRTR